MPRHPSNTETLLLTAIIPGVLPYARAPQKYLNDTSHTHPCRPCVFLRRKTEKNMAVRLTHFVQSI